MSCSADIRDDLFAQTFGMRRGAGRPPSAWPPAHGLVAVGLSADERVELTYDERVGLYATLTCLDDVGYGRSVSFSVQVNPIELHGAADLFFRVVLGHSVTRLPAASTIRQAAGRATVALRERPHLVSVTTSLDGRIRVTGWRQRL